MDYVTLASVKEQAGIEDTDDDARLPAYVAAVNAEIDRRVGVPIGPSVDTVRTYDGADAVASASRLWVPGGIRSLSQVRLSGTVADLGAFALRPVPAASPAGWPALRIDIIPGNGLRFPHGYADIELTGTFGWGSIPADLRKLADMVVLRMWQDRNAGGLSAPTPSKFIFPDDARMLDDYRHLWDQGAP